MTKILNISAACGGLLLSAILLSSPLAQAASQFSNDGRCEPYEQCYTSCISDLISASNGQGIQAGASNTTCNAQCIGKIDGRTTQVKDDCAFSTYKALRDGKMD